MLSSNYSVASQLADTNWHFPAETNPCLRDQQSFKCDDSADERYRFHGGIKDPYSI